MKNKIRKVVIPAAGLGTRFLPATKAQPKEMLPVVDKPIIQYVVEEVVASGIKDVVIVTGSSKRAIEDHFDYNYELQNWLKKQGKNKQRQEIIDSRIGWWARRQAKKKGITTEQYIIDKYNDIPDLQKVPEKPPEPEFKFEPRYKHEVPEFKFGFYMYGVHPDNNKWSFLGFEKKRERR